MKTLNKSVFNKKERPIKILQFGEGNFLRCFIEWIIQHMNNEGVINSDVCVVQPLEFGRVDALKEQDGLYTVILEGLNEGKSISQKEVIDVIGDLINPYTEYDKYLKYAQSTDLKYVISNTTEAGITLDETDTDFSKTPKTYPGKLLALLKARYDFFGGSKESALNLIPCELIDYNGENLKHTLVELAKIKGFDEKFISWLSCDCHYFNTLVDRIVPGYPRDDVQRFQEELGYVDNNMVKGEIFHLWVIEDHHSLQEEFPCDKASLNVKFVESFKPYKERKVKILNGSHTCMVPVSYLYGIDTVRETMENEVMNKFVRKFIFDEVVPTINLPHDDMVNFANSVLERYLNPYVRHELMSIALNSITKYKTRILPSVIENLEKRIFPKCALFSLSSLICFYFGSRGEEKINLSDNKEFLDLFEEYKSKYDGTKESCDLIVRDFLGMINHWEYDFSKHEDVVEYVSNYTYLILKDGMKVVLEEFVNEIK